MFILIYLNYNFINNLLQVLKTSKFANSFLIINSVLKKNREVIRVENEIDFYG